MAVSRKTKTDLKKKCAGCKHSREKHWIWHCTEFPCKCDSFKEA